MPSRGLWTQASYQISLFYLGNFMYRRVPLNFIIWNQLNASVLSSVFDMLSNAIQCF
ncbi:hypothetical protein AZE42_11230 [Rhizopogon vesiculosus]|uniref:Uncharacterized protein n=1 Tax=Rhizopogon vesiculosus TaxID=180088 RepID=A0A1J8QIK2_9AGAM|nr:hypothetical protein AZE42_11230 [Rhizopogon vesiculosus]